MTSTSTFGIRSAAELRAPGGGSTVAGAPGALPARSRTDERGADRSSGPAISVVALESVVSRAESLERRARELEAERLRLLAEAVDLAAVESDHPAIPHGEKGEVAYRAIRAELATALHLSEATVERKMEHAFTLTRHYRDTLDALEDGRMSERHAAVITDAGEVIGLGEEPDTVVRRAAYERAVLAVAEVENPSRLRPIARRLAEQYAETSIDERQEQARHSRRVTLTDRSDGMSDLIAHLPAIEAHAIYHRLTKMSRMVAEAEAGSDGADHCSAPVGEAGADAPRARRRSRDEIRADLFTDILTSATPEAAVEGGSHGLGGVQASVQVYITDRSLFAGTTSAPTGSDADTAGRDLPAELSGYGPISTATVRELASIAANWHAVHVEPSSGTILSVERYRPSAAIRRLLSARDEHCRFPGCRVPVHRCDIDHTVDAARGGTTRSDNLAHLCRGHHTLKHHGGWRVRQLTAGVLEWRSPTGRIHRERPPSAVRFTPVNPADPADPSVPTDSADPMLARGGPAPF